MGAHRNQKTFERVGTGNRGAVVKKDCGENTLSHQKEICSNGNGEAYGVRIYNIILFIIL